MRHLSDAIKWHGQWLNLSKKKYWQHVQTKRMISLSHDPTLTGKHIHIHMYIMHVRKWTGITSIYGHYFHTPFSHTVQVCNQTGKENCQLETCTSHSWAARGSFVCFFSFNSSLLISSSSSFTRFSFSLLHFCLHHMLPHFQNRDSSLQAANPVNILPFSANKGIDLFPVSSPFPSPLLCNIR